MPIIIDGYNLLCTCGFVGSKVGPGTLERARGSFLGFLCQVFPRPERSDVTVVFDSALRVSDLPNQVNHQGLQVHYATGHRDADEMIIEFIQRHSAPKTLLIVSSDHQIQVAAKRRRARFVDSEVWYDQILEQKKSDSTVMASAVELKAASTLEAKASETGLSIEESEKWMAEFRIREQADRGEYLGTSHEDAAGRRPEAAGSTADESAANPVSSSTPTSSERSPTEGIAGIGRGQSPALKHGPQADDALESLLMGIDELDLQSQFAVDTRRGVGAGPPSKRNPQLPVEPVAGPEGHDSPESLAAPEKPDSRPTTQSPVTPQAGSRPPGQVETVPQADGDARNGDQPAAKVSERQLERWNRQLSETTTDVFPPGYGEDVLFSDSFEIDDRLKRRRK
jgi:predicted RNA-binding protein with PIN domain